MKYILLGIIILMDKSLMKQNIKMINDMENVYGGVIMVKNCGKLNAEITINMENT